MPGVLIAGSSQKGWKKNDANPSRTAVFAKLDVLRHQRFSQPLPFGTAATAYEHVRQNTHTIRVAGRSGRFTVVLENVPAPGNPKTSWLACYSALAALRSLASRVRYGS